MIVKKNKKIYGIIYINYEINYGFLLAKKMDYENLLSVLT